MDSTSTCNTKSLEKGTYRKFKPTSYQKQSNTFFWEANCEITLFDITSTWNNNLTSQKYFENMF